jgi:hypothetical protein
MLASTARAAFLALALGSAAANTAAFGGELADFNAAVEKAEAHNRVAVGYLRTGNIDLASLEVDRLREAWAMFNERFAGKRPSIFDGNGYYIIAMTDIATRLITADLMLHTGHPDVTRQALLAIRNDLYKLRRSAGITVLADCVYDANNAMDTLMGFDGRGLDWKNADMSFDIAGKTAVYDYVLGRCDAMAGEAVRKDPEFRRLIDGARASMKLIPQAIAEHDTDLLHRVLIELRSFDNLLAFRFG